MASSATEGQIKNLRKAGYLSNDIAHRLPDVLVRRVEELSQRLVLSWVELPQIECPSLTQEDPAKSMTWTTLTSLTFLVTRSRTQVWSPVTSFRLPHDRPVSFQDVSWVGKPDQNSGAATHLGSRDSVI